MKDRPLEDRPACSVKSAPFPAEVQCTLCGKDIEMWSDEPETTCESCGSSVQNHEHYR